MSDGQTVYVVFSGYYSDTRVDAVFSTAAAAKHYCAVRGGRNEYEHELYYRAYDLDPLDRIATGRVWHQVDFADDGSAERVIFVADEDSTTDFEPEQGVHVTARTVSGKQWLRVWVEARDPEHAVKIAAKKRAEYLAEQAGIR